MANKQIDFHPMQKEDKRVAPFMLLLSVACIVAVVVVLIVHPSGPFIGPWG